MPPHNPLCLARIAVSGVFFVSETFGGLAKEERWLAAVLQALTSEAD